MVAKTENINSNQNNSFVNDVNGNVARSVSIVDGVTDYMIQVSRGLIPGASIKHIFGRNSSVGAALTPISNGGLYRTPTTTATLEVISTDANDIVGGTGARLIEITYLDSNFIEQTGTIATNGLAASTETLSGVKRLLFARVKESGTYATQTAGSHIGAITIRESGAGQDWAIIPSLGGFGFGSTQIGAYTIPAGYTAYLLKTGTSVSSNKVVNLYFFKREKADVTTAPFTDMEIISVFDGVSGSTSFRHETMEIIPEKTDIGFIGNDSTGSEASVEFELLLVQN